MQLKKRYLYTLLFGVPGFFIAGVFTMLLFGMSLGILWLFVFGDDPWPSSFEPVLAVVLVVVFLLVWGGSLWIGYRLGKRLESDPELNKTHIVFSVGITMAILLLILLQQWSVGNLGPKSDSVLCSEYCVSRGYAGSGLPPRDSGDRTCSCYDAAGNEAIRIPVDEMELK